MNRVAGRSPKIVKLKVANYPYFRNLMKPIFDFRRFPYLPFPSVPWIAGGYLLLLLSLPFAVDLPQGSLALEVPSEPLQILLVGRRLPLLCQWRHHHATLWKAPLLRISGLWLLWMLLTIPGSSAPLVSAKYGLVALTHWYLFAYLPLLIGWQLPQLLPRWFNLYTFPLLLLLLYAWSVHAQYDFRIDASVLVARPFFFDHALLSTALLLVLGPYLYALHRRRGRWHYAYPVVLLLLLGVYLSYSRAAWISALLALGLTGTLVLFRHYFRWMLGLTGLGLLGLALLLPSLWAGILQNRVESKKGNWWQQMASVANVTTDVSNLERLNRYRCAWRMVGDRPWRGFGAGTYALAYLPYQKPEEMTRISVTEVGPHPPGRGGGAHSEYFQALAELGWPGGLLFLALVLTSLFTAGRVYWSAARDSHRYLALALGFGLLTFFIHALFNNFFHHSKIAMLIWSSMAILIQLEREAADDRTIA